MPPPFGRPCIETPPGTGAGQIWGASPNLLASMTPSRLRYFSDIDQFVLTGVSSIGNANSIATSQDGETWVLRNSNGSAVIFRDVSRSQITGRLVAGGTRNGGVANNLISFSDDNGATWTNVNPSEPDMQTNGMIWHQASGLFVAGVGSFSGTPVGTRVMTSPTGAIWTPRSTPITNVTSLATDGTRIVAVGNGIMYSDDAAVWTNAGVVATWMDVVWSPALSLFTAINQSIAGFRVSTSPTGAVWTPRATPADNAWQRIAWGGPAANILAAVANSGTLNRIMVSTTAVSGWATRTPPDFVYAGIDYSTMLGKFVAAASSSGSTVFVISSTVNP
jgi:hypothetical protein